MKFKDTHYGDLTGKTYRKSISLNNYNITSLIGAPKKVKGDFDCSRQKLKTLNGAPKEVVIWLS